MFTVRQFTPFKAICFGCMSHPCRVYILKCLLPLSERDLFNSIHLGLDRRQLQLQLEHNIQPIPRLILNQRLPCLLLKLRPDLLLLAFERLIKTVLEEPRVQHLSELFDPVLAQPAPLLVLEARLITHAFVFNFLGYLR